VIGVRREPAADRLGTGSAGQHLVQAGRVNYQHRATGSQELRTLREATLARARSFIAVPYDERVAERLTQLLAAARDAGRRAGAMDAIIAATALAHDLAIWTQDDDFGVLAELAPELRIHRG
jgi:predicted nucleic acid-binding protein